MGPITVVAIALRVWCAGSMQTHSTDSSWWSRRCPGSEVGRTLRGEMALASVEGCPKRQQSKEEEHQGQSLAGGRISAMEWCSGLAWMWPVCVRCCSPWLMCPCSSQPWWGQWILQFVCTSPFIPVVNTDIPVASSWFSASLMLCTVTTGLQPVESPSPKPLKVLFFLKHIFTLQAAVQSQREEAIPFTRER